MFRRTFTPPKMISPHGGTSNAGLDVRHASLHRGRYNNLSGGRIMGIRGYGRNNYRKLGASPDIFPCLYFDIMTLRRITINSIKATIDDSVEYTITVFNNSMSISR
jgi:hypothetical protein